MHDEIIPDGELAIGMWAFT